MSTPAAHVTIDPLIDPERSAYALRLGMALFLATVTMMFGAFGSAYIVRGASADWAPVALPAATWLNTLAILASSATLWLARARRRAGARRAARDWWAATILLGMTFLLGQIGVGRQLAASGVTLPSSPYGAFVYILGGIHALHLVAGLVLLAVAAWRSKPASVRRWTDSPDAGELVGELAATFWHFLGALWVYLLVLLTVFS